MKSLSFTSNNFAAFLALSEFFEKAFVILNPIFPPLTKALPYIGTTAPRLKRELT